MVTVQLEADEIDEILRTAGSGVLSLCNGTETYAVPESFGYDGDVLYFQLVHDDDSEKMAFIETTDAATFTVYDESPAESVIVRGPIETVPEDDRAVAMNAIAENAAIPTLNVSPTAALDDLSMNLYQLRPADVSGRAFGNRRDAAENGRRSARNGGQASP
ncbi:pyridoxamine 5'-phosphate oxidase family protein [Halopenitus persicus]|uniref:pyridoxamine 5'-phosphate oxidase family protein n=1 Tax=Halopenitus persicus TaxID=1048396 RepID=UPI000BBAA42F|nr:pyridoxamine 5'-phosphate oxidase family protein [Halopenitus persicus]